MRLTFFILVSLFSLNAYGIEDLSKSLGSKEEIRKRLLLIVDSAKQYQDALDHQIQALKEENKALHEKLMQFKDFIESDESVLLEKKASSENITSIMQNEAFSSYSSPPDEISVLKGFSEKFFLGLSHFKLMGGIFTLIILTFIWFLSRKRSLKTAHQKAQSKAVIAIGSQELISPVFSAHEEGEYDYLGSDESVPSRLDLARMYTEMSDFLAAEEVLKTVMAQGDEKQCSDAEKLLKEIKELSVL
jgi:FimV-like protein